MKKLTLRLKDSEYNAILNQTKFVRHFIKQAIHEKLKSKTVGMQNFNELSQQKSYQPHFNGDGIRIPGSKIKANHGYAEIMGDKRQLELVNHQPMSSINPKLTYVVVGEDNQVNNVIIKPVAK